MKLCVIGLGKLGLPLAGCLAKHNKVIGIDKWHWKPNIKEPKLGELLDHVKVEVRTDYKYIKNFKVVFVIVPTPSIEDGTFTNSFVEEVLLELKTINYEGIVSIVSTMMPNSTDCLTKKYGLRIVYNPTFIALGSVINDLCNPSFILIGENNKKDGDILVKIYKQLCGKVKFARMKPLEAEICKLSLNCFLTTKISFANTIGNLCDILGVNGDVIMQTIGVDKRVNPAYLKPGLGFGGPCFPRDNQAFCQFSNTYGVYPYLSEATQYINKLQPSFMVKKIKKLGIKEISIPSLSYKEGTDNQEHSQLKMIKINLILLGIKINPNAKWELNHGGLVCKKGR